MQCIKQVDSSIGTRRQDFVDFAWKLLRTISRSQREYLFHRFVSWPCTDQISQVARSPQQYLPFFFFLHFSIPPSLSLSLSSRASHLILTTSFTSPRWLLLVSMSLALRWTPFPSDPRSTSRYSPAFPSPSRQHADLVHKKFPLSSRAFISRHGISAGLPRTTHLPSSVAEVYFNLPAVKACQFLPSSLISVPYNSIQFHPFASLSLSLYLSFFFFISSFPRFVFALCHPRLCHDDDDDDNDGERTPSTPLSSPFRAFSAFPETPFVLPCI